MRFLFRFWVLFLIAMGLARPASAHPMGNFSINHFARFEARKGALALRTILDFAEIPSTERMDQLDPNGDQTFTASEKRAFLKQELARAGRSYSLRINGRKVALQLQNSRLDVRPGAGGLQTLRVIADWKVALPSQATNRVAFSDSNFEGRNGWMEIIAVAARGQKISDSDAAKRDLSRELTVFSLDAGAIAPRQRQASFSVVSGAGGAASAQNSTSTAPQIAEKSPSTNDQTPQNGFTQSIAAKELTPGLIFGGLLAALAFGAVHALSPGHGKTMVAAYLVGSRGTPRHAVTLGLVVTVTHTLGVFALGAALLFASRYVLPERLFPILSAASGLLIFGVGLWLFMSRYQDLMRGQEHEHGDGEHLHQYDGHTHEHDGHSHDTHVHSHGGRAHSHAVPDGPITLKTLVALGISGGIVPCPEALVVLLAAVKLHRIGYGMLLITAFSIGLAAALIAIGLFVVAARERLGAISTGRSSVLTRYLPLGSAAAITLIGIVLTLQATTGGS